MNIRFQPIWILALVLGCVLLNDVAFGGEAIEAKPGALRAWLLQKVDEATAARAAEIAKLKTPELIAARQKMLREKFIEAIGGFPERTPINAAVKGVVKKDGFSVEKILFESRPGFFVTAALFLPDPAKFAPPWPGILVPCGHSDPGKALDAYQRGSALAALNGMAALLFDPIEQGERGHGSVNGHNAIGRPAMLVGASMAQIEIWDGMRAIDYLQTRADILKDKIGCMGNSGGGTQTSYLLALDERIQAAAPSCYITSLAQVTRSIGPQDAEQNIFGQLAFGMDHADYLSLRAPVPVLLCSAIQDFFPIAGARGAFAEGRSIFETLGKSDRINMVENDGKHGWAKPLREGAVRWMCHWLRGVDTPVTESETLGVLTEQEILVTDSGDVMKLPGARSVFEVLREVRAKLPAPPKRTPEELARIVSKMAGIRDANKLAALTVREKESEPRKLGGVARMVFEREGMPLPALLYMPAEPTKAAPVLLVHSNGQQKARAIAEKKVAEGLMVLSLDLRGFGETANAKPDFYGDADGGDAFLAYLLGGSLAGQRAEDILCAARWLSAETRGIELIAANWAVTPALHAAVVESKLFARVTLMDEPANWNDVLLKPGKHPYSDLIHGVLKKYDLPDLKAALGEKVK